VTAFEMADGELFHGHVGLNQWSRNSGSTLPWCRESDAMNCSERLHVLRMH